MGGDSTGKVVAVQLASKIHGEEYSRELAACFRNYLEKFKEITVVPRVVTSFDEVKSIAHEFKGYYPLIIFLTGGTSKLARALLHYLEEDSAVFIAHSEHNSLPSAISARARLEIEGISSWIFTCHNPKDSRCGNVSEEAARIAIAASAIRGAKVCLVGLEEEPSEVEGFRRAFNAEVDIISPDDFDSLVKSKTDSADVSEFLDMLTAAVGIDANANRSILKEIGAVYAALKTLLTSEGYNAIAINCFPYLIKHKVTPCLALAALNSRGYVAACEADLTATFLMMVSKHLTGSSGWIANPSGTEDYRLYLAHCTAPIDLLSNSRILDHFESGYPYGLTGQLRHNDITVTSVDYEFTSLAAAKAKVLKSGLLSGTMCRTQAEVLLTFPAKVFPQVALANHHVIMPGDLRRYLKILAHTLGLSYLDYEELAREVLTE
ncbi:MAG: hypothetical protein DRO14_01915 [Thermoprotei archaeon]|nr:MAG: hypothetical protein DRO14_01915 [Thermoprotei archaeon]